MDGRKRQINVLFYTLYIYVYTLYIQGVMYFKSLQAIRWALLISWIIYCKLQFGFMMSCCALQMPVYFIGVISILVMISYVLT